MKVRYVSFDLNHKPHCYQQKKRDKQGGSFARELKKAMRRDVK